MFSDRETEIDALGFEPYVQSLSELIVEKGITPFTMGIFGTWGTGKTSLMSMLRRKLESSGDVKTVWFNAWKFEDREQIWTALIQTILNKLEFSPKQKVKQKLKKLRDSVEWIQLSEFLGKFIISGLPDFGALTECFKFKESIRSIAEFENEFEELIETCGIKRLVVFIDDLDRCERDATSNILEAIKLLLNSKNCVYVLGLDYERACDAILKRFSEDSKEIAENYLEKIIQLSFHIPRRTEGDMRLYLRYLFALQYLVEEKHQSFAEDVKKIGENIDEEFVQLLKGYVGDFSMDEYRIITEYDLLVIRENGFNPRKLKRFLNIYELRRSLSNALNLNLENEYIIKFLLLQTRFVDFYRDLEGNRDLLKDLIELDSSSDEEAKNRLKESGLLEQHYSSKELLRFLRDMSFKDIDPRPYLRIAETARVETIVIGKKEERVVGNLMSEDTALFEQGQEDFHRLSVGEREKVIHNLIEKTENNKADTRRRSERALEKMALANDLTIDQMEDHFGMLMEKTDSKSVLVRREALQILGRMREIIPADLIEDVVEKLIEKTDDRNDSVKRDALQILGRMREIIPADLIEDVVEKLIEKTDDRNDSVKRDAFHVLKGMIEIIPADLIEDVVGRLIEKTHDQRFFVIENAISVLKAWRDNLPEELRGKIDQIV